MKIGNKRGESNIILSRKSKVCKDRNTEYRYKFKKYDDLIFLKTGYQKGDLL